MFHPLLATLQSVIDCTPPAAKAAKLSMPEHSNPAVESASELFGLSAQLKTSWRYLSALDRDRLLADLIAGAAILRTSLESPNAPLNGPTADEVRSQFRAPTSHVCLQPIISLQTRGVVGFEALSRFPEWSPDRWFQRAWETGIGLEFELLAVERALPTLAALPNDVYLSMNVSPLTLIARELRNIVRRSDPQRIVLELTEYEPIGDYELYRDQVMRLRGRGTRIAIDDVGAGHSSLRRIIQLKPDIIKLDRALIAGCDTDPMCRVLMTCIATFARETGTCVIAEGVETAEEAAALISYGIVFGQGYYFGRPEPHATRTASA